MTPSVAGGRALWLQEHPKPLGILPADNLRLPEPTGMQWDEHDERL